MKDWLDEEMEREGLISHRSEAARLREQHAASCDAAELRRSHNMDCDARQLKQEHRQQHNTLNRSSAFAEPDGLRRMQDAIQQAAKSTHQGNQAPNNSQVIPYYVYIGVVVCFMLMALGSCV